MLVIKWLYIRLVFYIKGLSASLMAKLAFYNGMSSFLSFFFVRGVKTAYCLCSLLKRVLLQR